MNIIYVCQFQINDYFYINIYIYIFIYIMAEANNGKFNYIVDVLVPNYLKTKNNYVVLGGKCYSYYFKDINTIDWDIAVFDITKEAFIDNLKKYIVENSDITDEDLEKVKASFTENETDIKLLQLGYKPYSKQKYDDRFFIDVKECTGLEKTKYEITNIDGINFCSLNYLYKDSITVLKDRQLLYYDSVQQTDETQTHIKNDENIISVPLNKQRIIILNELKILCGTLLTNTTLKQTTKDSIIKLIDEIINCYNLNKFKDLDCINLIKADLFEEFWESKLGTWYGKPIEKDAKRYEDKCLLRSFANKFERFFELEKFITDKKQQLKKTKKGFINTQLPDREITREKYNKSNSRLKILLDFMNDSSVKNIIHKLSDKYLRYIIDTCKQKKNFIIQISELKIEINCKQIKDYFKSKSTQLTKPSVEKRSLKTKKPISTKQSQPPATQSSKSKGKRPAKLPFNNNELREMETLYALNKSEKKRKQQNQLNKFLKKATKQKKRSLKTNNTDSNPKSKKRKKNNNA